MQPTIVRNNLISRQGLRFLLGLPEEGAVYVSLLEILTKFQTIKKFASEIHTEIHLIKPILKMLGYFYESKPKYFADHIKGPDTALFASEGERERASQFWGTQEYYGHTIGVLLLKRFGRNLEEGISGFFLEFENRIPLYQLLYFLKNTKTPWGILTNGKQWILMKKPLAYEAKVFSIDLEDAVQMNDRETLHLFYKVFSQNGLARVLPDILEGEREGLVDRLKGKKTSIRNAVCGFRKKNELFPRIINNFSDLLEDKAFPITEHYLQENGVTIADRLATPGNTVDIYNLADISSYLLNKKSVPLSVDFEKVFLLQGEGSMTKEDLLSMKILDMTPGFGNIATEIIDSIAYFSFILPYREKNTFVAEWENESTLRHHIIDNVLYGIEKSHIAFDILQKMMRGRYGMEATNYKFGNPLIGMSLADIAAHMDMKSQSCLFSKNLLDFLADISQMYRQYFSLSEKIKEDLTIREELKVRLSRYSNRLRDVMDIITSTYFSKTVDQKKIYEAISMLEADDDSWKSLSSLDWFVETKRIANRNGFYHVEIEFPFLVNGAFDHIFIRPALAHIWEDDFPLVEITKAYIKRGMTYLKTDGHMVIIFERVNEELLRDLAGSKRYDLQAYENMIILSRRNNSTSS